MANGPKRKEKKKYKNQWKTVDQFCDEQLFTEVITLWKNNG